MPLPKTKEERERRERKETLRINHNDEVRIQRINCPTNKPKYDLEGKQVSGKIPMSYDEAFAECVVHM